MFCTFADEASPWAKTITSALHEFSYTFVPVQEEQHSHLLIYSNSTFEEASPPGITPKNPAVYLLEPAPGVEKESYTMEGHYSMCHLR